MARSAHVDVYMSVNNGTVFHVGHADVESEPEDTVRSRMASVLHQVAWHFEEENENNPMRGET